MAKTKAQKARARARKNNASLSQGKRGKGPRLIRGPVARPGNKKRRKRNGKGRKGKGRTVSDGISKGKIFQNSSTIVDPFRMRREKVCNVINNTTSFSIQQQFYLNPGNSTLHPIFSQIAATYEQYQVKKLRFVYEDRMYTASGSVVGAPKVIMTTSYDVDDALFISDTQMENYVGSMTFPGYTASVSHDCIAFRKKRNRGLMPLNDYFVYPSANGETPLASAGKFYDFGQFQLAVLGGSDTTSIIGELFVEYQYEMINPKQSTASGGFSNALMAHIVESGPASATTVAPLGIGGGSVRPGSTLTSITSNIGFTIPSVGTYLVASMHTGTLITTATSGFILGSNVSTGPNLERDSVAFGTTTVNTAGTIAMFTGIYTVNAPGTTFGSNGFTYTGLTGMVGATADVFICQLVPGITAPRKGICEGTNVKTDTRIGALENQLEQLMRLLKVTLDVNPKSLCSSKHIDEEHKTSVESLELAATDSEPDDYNSAIELTRCGGVKRCDVKIPETPPVSQRGDKIGIFNKYLNPYVDKK